MEVHVVVGIDVVERQSGCVERFELGPDLTRELAANARENEKSDAGTGHVPVEPALTAEEMGDLLLAENRMAVDQVQMQADAKLGKTMGAGHRIGRRLASDHQARG
jgi:hypothetical protein